MFRRNNGKAEVLLGLRLNNPGRRKWSFPGGEAEGKEKLLTAGIREFREEVGVQLYGRYITKIGVYKIQNPLFDWETQIIETTQDINPKGIGDGRKTSEAARTYGGEFFKLDWVNIEELDHLQLHRWVREVVDVYNSDSMKPYIPKPSEKKVVPVSKPRPKMNGADCLFDVAEMLLAKTDPDGTKYFMPRSALAKAKVGSAWK